MNPTYVGYINSTKDALLIIQSTLNNQLVAVSRRPHDRERPNLIKSGNVFVFIEERSGIKRWTDGVAWSPSRILGRFLVYRELDRNAKEDEEKRKNGSKRNSVDNKSLVGSLSTSYAFKEAGLIKKTLSLTIAKSDGGNETVHLVSYYSAQDVLSGKLLRPIDSPETKDIQLSTNLWNAIKENSLGGKIPIEDESYYLIDASNPNAIALGFQPQQQSPDQRRFSSSSSQCSNKTYPTYQNMIGPSSSSNNNTNNNNQEDMINQFIPGSTQYVVPNMEKNNRNMSSPTISPRLVKNENNMVPIQSDLFNQQLSYQSVPFFQPISYQHTTGFVQTVPPQTQFPQYTLQHSPQSNMFIVPDQRGNLNQYNLFPNNNNNNNNNNNHGFSQQNQGNSINGYLYHPNQNL